MIGELMEQPCGVMAQPQRTSLRMQGSNTGHMQRKHHSHCTFILTPIFLGKRLFGLHPVVFITELFLEVLWIRYRYILPHVGECPALFIFSSAPIFLFQVNPQFSHCVHSAYTLLFVAVYSFLFVHVCYWNYKINYQIFLIVFKTVYMVTQNLNIICFEL